MKNFYREVKPNLVLLHGWGLSKETWKNILPSLADSYIIYSLDILGFGNNQGEYTIFTLENYMKQINDFLKENKIENCILLGHSFGGTLAILYTLQYPEKIKKLILYSSGSPLSIKDQGISYSMRKFVGGNLVLLFSIISRGWRNKRLNWNDIIQLKKIRSGIKPRIKQEVLQEITQPVLLIAGRFDPLSPLSFQNRIVKYFPNAQIEVFNKSTHVAHKEESSKFISIIRKFISTQ